MVWFIESIIANMTQMISNEDMTNVRRSLAQAGIYFDKLYINQVE
jgi:hypothetical protein